MKTLKVKEEPNFLLKFGHRIEGVENGCKMCGSPWHPSTGDSRGFCGPCCRSLVQTYIEVANPKRTWGGIPFYKHATVPE